MPTLARILVGIVAAIHIAIAVGEMLLWKPFLHEGLGYSTAPLVLKSECERAVRVGSKPEEVASIPEVNEVEKVAPIVANAGLFNAFLAAGLVWGLVAGRRARPVVLYVLLCVVIAGVFGAVTVKWTTVVLQTIPALAALAAVRADRSEEQVSAPTV